MNTQPNRWLKGYLERIGQNNAFHAHVYAPIHHSWLTTFSSHHPFLFNVIASLISTAILLIANRALFTRPPMPITVTMPVVSGQNPLFAIKLERVHSKTDLLKLTQKFPESMVAAPLWNPLSTTMAPQREIYGQPSKRESYYLPIPRAGQESYFAQISRFPELKLYEIHISPKISEKEFSTHPYLWAAHCHVEKMSIDQWSSWQTPLGDPILGFNSRFYPFPTRLVFFENDCRPGGTCFVIAFDCDAQAQADFQSVQDNGPAAN
ncbi:MAG TPA: hypothetical protein VJW20_18150 [Candidatus Angelobacter sp.]|nr:hypothetical protein [Candidatus Angelobacter sp.]